MKIRNGFVSNSSSSSFVIITTEENHKRALKEVHPYVKAVVESLESTKEKFLGKKVLILNYMTGNCDTFESLDIDFEGTVPNSIEDPGEEMQPWEAMGVYEQELQKNKDEVIVTSGSDC